MMLVVALAVAVVNGPRALPVIIIGSMATLVLNVLPLLRPFL
jgi:hypothetical protein